MYSCVQAAEREEMEEEAETGTGCYFLLLRSNFKQEK